MSMRPFIESTLADAEADLARLVARNAAEDELESARLYCRNARVALRELNMREGKPRDYRKRAEVTSLPLLSRVQKQSSREVQVLIPQGAGMESKHLKWQAVQAVA